MFNKYKIILTPFPFTDLSSSKVRPAIIVSKESIGDDVVVVFISSQNNKKFGFDLSLLKSKINGLKTDSVIRVSKIATLDKKIILGEIGELDKSLQKKLDSSLTKMLGL